MLSDDESDEIFASTAKSSRSVSVTNDKPTSSKTSPDRTLTAKDTEAGSNPPKTASSALQSEKPTSVYTNIDISSSEDSDNDDGRDFQDKEASLPTIDPTEVVLVISDTESESEGIARRSRRSRRSARLPFYGEPSELRQNSTDTPRSKKNSTSSTKQHSGKRALSPGFKGKSQSVVSEVPKKKSRRSKSPVIPEHRTAKKPLPKSTIGAFLAQPSTPKSRQQVFPLLPKHQLISANQPQALLQSLQSLPQGLLASLVTGLRAPMECHLVDAKKSPLAKPAFKQRTLDEMLKKAVATSPTASKAGASPIVSSKVSKPGSTPAGSGADLFSQQNSTTFSRSFSNIKSTKPGPLTSTGDHETPSKSKTPLSTSKVQKQGSVTPNPVDANKQDQSLKLPRPSASPTLARKRKADGQTSTSEKRKRVSSGDSSLNVRKDYALFSDDDEENDKDGNKIGDKQSMFIRSDWQKRRWSCWWVKNDKQKNHKAENNYRHG